MRTAVFSSLAVTLLAALVASPASAQKRWLDQERGFSVKPIPRWAGVPVTPTERYTAAKWASKRNERDFPCRMMVHVFERPTPKKVDRGTQPASTTKYERGASPFGQKGSFRSWSQFNRRGMKLAKGKKLRIKAPKGVKYTAMTYEGTRDSGYTRGGKRLGNYYWLVAIITTNEREYAVEMFCGEVVKRKYRAQFVTAAKSFTLLDVKEPATAAGSKDALTPREEARRVARANVKVEGWWFIESKNYIIVTNVPERKSARIKAIRDQLERIRKLYERDFPPEKPIEAVSIVRVCKSKAGYQKYGGRPGTAGYWASMAKELVLYMAGEKAFALSVLNHEAFHQYIYYACGRLAPHSWYNEGYGDYYAGAKVTGKRAILKPFKWRVGTIRTHIRQGTYVPLKEFVRYTQGQYYSKPDLCYAQGWSLIWFFNKGLPKRHPWDQILPTYFRVLQQTDNRAKAVDTAFADVDMEELEKAWKTFIVKGKKAPRPKKKGPSKKPPAGGTTPGKGGGKTGKSG